MFILVYYFCKPYRWKEAWLDRLNKSSEPWIHIWLSHQSRDAYWQHGSISEDYASIKCPVFLVGGFCDLYTDAIFRMVEHLKCPVRVLIGPWPHKWPGIATPGPRIDHLKECLRWWDYHLKGLPTGVMDEPVMRVYMRDSMLSSVAFLFIFLIFLSKTSVCTKTNHFYGPRHFEGAPEGDMAREMDSRRLLALTKCTPTRIFPTN